MYIHVPVIIMQEIPSLHLYSGAVSRKERVNNHRSHPGVVMQQFSKETAKRKLKANICIKETGHHCSHTEVRQTGCTIASLYAAKSPHLCLTFLRM